MTLLIKLPSTMNPIGAAVISPAAAAQPTPLLGPKIDPNDHDFLSLFEGMDAVDSQVVLAMKLKRNSGPSVGNQGQDFESIKKITESTPNDVKAQVRRALNRLITNGDIRFEGTQATADNTNQQVNALAEWVNLRAFDAAVRSSELILT